MSVRKKEFCDCVKLDISSFLTSADWKLFVYYSNVIVTREGYVVEEWVCRGRMGMSWKNGYVVEEWVCRGRMDMSWENGYVVEEWVCHGRMGMSWKNEYVVEEWASWQNRSQRLMLSPVQPSFGRAKLYLDMCLFLWTGPSCPPKIGQWLYFVCVWILEHEIFNEQ